VDDVGGGKGANLPPRRHHQLLLQLVAVLHALQQMAERGNEPKQDTESVRQQRPRGVETAQHKVGAMR
jgi:hypothetical protein